MSIRKFLRNLREKYRFSVRNQQTDTEVWYMHISPGNLLAGFLALVLTLFVIVATTVAYTPILDFIPGYPGNKSREVLVGGIMRLDSLENELSKMQLYNENVALIMAGKNPATRNEVKAPDSTARAAGPAALPAEDSLLRRQMESPEGAYSLAGDPARRQLRTSLELFAPVKGVVVNKFDPAAGSYGLGIGTTVNQPVMAIADGTVVTSAWTPSNGYVLYVQHADNLLSVYRNNTSSLKKTGERVRGGEIVANTGSAEAQGLKNVFEFELWHGGVPVDPQAYIVF